MAAPGVARAGHWAGGGGHLAGPGRFQPGAFAVAAGGPGGHGQPGDTIPKIAKAFHGTPEEIASFPGNNLDPLDPQITQGQTIIIPGGWRDLVVWQLPVVSRKTVGVGGSSGEPGACAGPFSGPTGTLTFQWPANNHYLSVTDFLPSGHPGIDIAAGLGSPIYASDSGVVVF